MAGSVPLKARSVEKQLCGTLTACSDGDGTIEDDQPQPVWRSFVFNVERLDVSTFSQPCCAVLGGMSRCDAGWCEDFEGYWEAAVYKDCGDKGFNSWSGAAGAYCCSGP